MSAGATVRIAAVEAGGTKMIAALCDADGTPLEQTRIATRDPQATLTEVRDFLEAAQSRHGAAQATGVASFGPLALDPRASDFAHLRRTPKPGWSGTDLRAMLPATLRAAPFAIDTDVNAAALAEQRHGAGRGLASLAYVTVGTGIGVGLVIDGRPAHGLLHPEAGHLWPRRAEDDAFPGLCPFHGDCFEGLASGPAISARWGAPLDALPPDHRAFSLQADYLGQLAAQILLLASPQRLVFGGGVMAQATLFPRLRARARHWLGDYLDSPALAVESDGCDGLDVLIVAPGLGAQSGLRGAFELGRDALLARAPR